MDRDTANEVFNAALRSGDELQKLLPLLKTRCSADEYDVYLKAVATAMAEIGIELVNRVVAEHPELGAEMEARSAEAKRRRIES
jgi:hypothetical protein